MRSAFGVDHGEGISKSLVSGALGRIGGKGIKEGGAMFRMGEKGARKSGQATEMMGAGAHGQGTGMGSIQNKFAGNRAPRKGASGFLQRNSKNYRAGNAKQLSRSEFQGGQQTNPSPKIDFL